MPYNGSGLFTRLYSWTAQALIPHGIDQVQFDADGNDIASGLSNCITRDGQGIPSADISWNNHKITTLAAPTALEDAVNLATMQANALRVDGTSQTISAANQLLATTSLGLQPLIADGQVQISVSSSTVSVAPLDGGNIVINGTQRQLASTISVTPATSVSTLYYVYLAMDTPPTMTVEISTTAYTADAAGRKNKTGDVTRRLVGMVYTSGSGTFSNTQTFRGCLNYFNRRDLFLSTTLTGSTASTSYVIATGVVTFLTWADEAVDISTVGNVANSTLGGITTMSPTLDGSAAGTPGVMQSYTGTALGAVSGKHAANPAEGSHSAGGAIKVSAGTGTINTVSTFVLIRG